MFVKIEYPTAVVLRELALVEINACIDAARSARLRASQKMDFRESDVALLYENRASILMDFTDQIDSLRRNR